MVQLEEVTDYNSMKMGQVDLHFGCASRKVSF